MVVTFFVAPLLRVESALAGGASEFRLAARTHQLRSFLPFEVFQVILVELQRAKFLLTLGAEVLFIAARHEAFHGTGATYQISIVPLMVS